MRSAKIAVVAVFAVLSLSMTGCSSGTSTSGSSAPSSNAAPAAPSSNAAPAAPSSNAAPAAPSSNAAPAAQKGTIAFLLSGPDTYYQYGLKGAQAAAAKLGYKIAVFPNPNTSPSVELANVQNAIQQKVVAIDGYSVGLATETASINKASGANIPIFLMYGYSSNYLKTKGVIGFEQTPLVPYGVPDGKYLLDHLKAGDQVGIITGQLGRGDAEGYRTGFLNGLECKGDTVKGDPPLTCGQGIKYVTQQTGKWQRTDAFSVMKNMIAEYPNLKGLYVENEDMAVGAHTALVAANKTDVLMVSANGAPYGLKGVQDGWLAATNSVSPSLEGLYSVRFIDAYLNQKITGGKLYYSHTNFVSKNSMDEAVAWDFIDHPDQVDHWMNQPLLEPVASPPGS